jgi:cytochrome P450
MSDTLAATDEDAALEYPATRSDRCPFDPPAALEELRAGTPIARVRIWDGSTPWLVTGHAEQRAVLGDPRVSTEEKLAGFPHQNQGMAETVDHRPPTIFNTDGEEHGRIRRMMTGPFTAKRVQALRDEIQRITDDLLDTMLAGPKPADLVTALALPLPTLMICALLGTPYEDHELFQQCALVAVDRNATAEENAKSAGALVEYLAGQIAARIQNPTDDVLSEFAARVKAGELTVPEAALMSVVLLIAGHETSANMIALGTLALFENPEQFAVLRETDDPKVVADAVEELLRYLTIAHTGQRRIAVEDIEIGGETIRTGEGIILDLPTANRDPEAFPEPGRLDLRRAARQHHAFGFGIHQCVGQQLARIELQVVYGTLYRRIPTLRLATTFDKIQFKHDRLAYGVYELPVTW